MGVADRGTDDDQPGLVARYGQLLDEQERDSVRVDRLANLVIDVLREECISARRAQAADSSGPAVGVVLDGVAYLIEVTCSPVGQDKIRALAQAGAARPAVRLGLLSVAGYEPDVWSYLHAGAGRGLVLLDRRHFEAMLCGLASPATLVAEAAHRAVFDNQPYTSLTDLLLGDAPAMQPPHFVASDRLPTPWPLTVRAAPGVQVRHMFSGDGSWGEPLGLAVVDRERALVTLGQGIVDVDLKRGVSVWLVPLSGCRGAPLVLADGSVLTLCGAAVVQWREGELQPVGGGFGDARTLVPGPHGEAWVLSGHGATLGSGTGTLALTRLGDGPGQQHRYHVHFDADVHTAGWLSDLKFFLAAAGNSAVVDLACSTAVRREDWIETPHHSPDHLVVIDPQTVITASPDGSGAYATLYRTDVCTRRSDLITEIATNRIHGLAAVGDRGLCLLGDVRGNDVQVPHPILVAVRTARRDAPNAEATHPAIPVSSLQTASLEPPSDATDAVSASSHRTSTTAAAAMVQPADPYDPVRLAACGSRRAYALDPAPIASGGQATVTGATHKATGVRVAFKKLHSHSPDDVARMRREVEAAQLFGGHPHVMPVLDFSPTYDWFVMPLVADTAQTLATELRSLATLRGLVTSLCEALREPHQHGWIHRDLKPDNILKRDGRWAVADWGLGRRPRGQTTDPRRTQIGGRFGTEGFAAPELSVDAHGIGPQADIYSIGQIIGWALTEEWPRANVPLLPGAGPWRNIAKASTRPDPADRPATVDDLLTLIAYELDDPPEIPANRGEHLLKELRAGDPTAVGQLFDLAARHPGDYDLYLQVLVNLDDGQIRSAITANPSAAREIVRGVLDLHSDAGVTLEYGDVDVLVTWLLVIARNAEAIAEWDLLEDTAESIFYLDHWDRWRVQADIRSWMATRSGHSASVVAAALRRNPEILTHFDSLATDRHVDHRIRQVLGSTA
ncbi:protein kinase domain-containing protein [Micromonospora haikouensis]|uniref:protein kinase domain-containing protein n=1 Tax=Micromonospora haikouensis TaxID=686309 RepID=UPI003D746853